MWQPDELSRRLRELATSLIRSIPADALSRTAASTLSCLAREALDRRRSARTPSSPIISRLSPDETVVIEQALPVLNHLMEPHVA